VPSLERGGTKQVPDHLQEMTTVRPAQLRHLPGFATPSMRAGDVCTLVFGIAIVAIYLACADYPLIWDEWISLF